ncbi:hypothetical protein QR680_015815 [Steinernema hermaphroditum]|uniref:SHSP domain-containing protein n=1 Tax=Steinernema hermaphroditum TaxID=289476 RepID=A0AA39HA31_9BILA|nr:hypothetical protein QR680_015815 [Steinernema hermaphroditum]
MSAIEVAHEWKAEQWDWPMAHNDGVVQLINTHDKFEVGLDCQFFTPKEIEVKVIENKLVVHCLHESRTDKHGEIKREINRTYALPGDVDTGSLRSFLTQKGVLQITAQKKK